MEMMANVYRCVWCGALLPNGTPTELHCARCDRSYPVVDEIPLLTLRPHSLLRTATDTIRSTEHRIATLSDALSAGRESYATDPLTRGRAQRTLAGMRSNLELVAAHMKSVALLAAGLPKQGLLESLANVGAGWSADAMLPYFYQDWADTEHFSRVKTLILSALRRYRPNATSIAVLGAGACGLVHAVAEEFDTVYGVDLSLGTLLIARAMLGGEAITIHLENADWHAVQLCNARHMKNNIRLVAADVVNLPFPDNSLDAIVTQYLMDIVGNPLHVARQIRRVLKKGGVWVNFSLPLHISGEPQELGRFTLEELPGFLRLADLQLIESAHESFSIMDLKAVNATAPGYRDSVHFYVARNPTDVSSHQPIRGASIVATTDDPWWETIPRIVPGRKAEIAAIAGYGSEGTDQRHIVSFRFSFGPQRNTLDSDAAEKLGSLLQLIDGQRSHRQIYTTAADRGVGLDPVEFCEWLHYLRDRFGLIGPVLDANVPRDAVAG